MSNETKEATVVIVTTSEDGRKVERSFSGSNQEMAFTLRELGLLRDEERDILND